MSASSDACGCGKPARYLCDGCDAPICSDCRELIDYAPEYFWKGPSGHGFVEEDTIDLCPRCYDRYLDLADEAFEAGTPMPDPLMMVVMRWRGSDPFKVTTEEHDQAPSS